MKIITKEKIYPTSRAIRKYLLENKFVSPSDFYRYYKEFKPTTSYESIVRYFYLLRKLGLVEIDHRESSGRKIPKSIYKLVPDKVEDPRWANPQAAMYLQQ